MARDVFGQIVGSAHVVVVVIELIGDASKSPEKLEIANRLRFEGIARPIDFGRRWTFGSEAVELLLEGRINFLRRVARPRGHFDLKQRSQLQRPLIGIDRLRDLFLVHESFV